VLSATSQQFGPHLIRTFMSDKANQVVLGSFLAAFLYCLVVLALEGSGAERAVPRVSLTIALLLAALNLGMLIFYIHHVAATLKSTGIAARVGHEFIGTIERLYPESEDEPSGKKQPAGTSFFERTAVGAHLEVRASGPGYVQAIDRESLLALATGAGLTIQVIPLPSDFVIPGDLLARAAPAENVGEHRRHEIERAILLGREPTLEQDAAHGASQLLEVAERALSPGINDPHTALACLNWLGVGLAVLVQRKPREPVVYDNAGTPRLFLSSRDFADLLNHSFSQLRYYARSAPTVLIRMLEIIGSLRELARENTSKAVLERHADLILELTHGLEDSGWMHLVRVAHHRATLASFPDTTDSK